MVNVSITIDQEWSFEYFLTYILLHVASSDHHVDEKEMQQINIALQDLTHSDVHFDEIYDDIHVFVEKQSPQEREAFIKKYKHQFITTENARELVIQGIEEVIMADLNIESDEMDTYRFIKRILRD